MVWLWAKWVNSGKGKILARNDINDFKWIHIPKDLYWTQFLYMIQPLLLYRLFTAMHWHWKGVFMLLFPLFFVFPFCCAVMVFCLELDAMKFGCSQCWYNVFVGLMTLQQLVTCSKCSRERGFNLPARPNGRKQQQRMSGQMSCLGQLGCHEQAVYCNTRPVEVL